MLLLLPLAALATGLPPQDVARPVGPDCAPLSGPSDTLRLSYDRITGSCAPPSAPGEDSCSHTVQRSLPARELSLWRAGCEEPLEGRFVRDGSCGEVPRWRWTGRLDAGHRHLIGIDGGATLGVFDASGAPSTAPCPTESPRTDLVQTPVLRTEHTGVRWLEFPEEGYAVVPLPDGRARLQWTPETTLAHWFPGHEQPVLESEPLDAAEARRWLETALREPGGIAVRHRTATSREHHEGWTRRGVAYCERVLEMDVEQRFRDGGGSDELGPPLRITTTLREPTAAAHCAGE